MPAIYTTSRPPPCVLASAKYVPPSPRGFVFGSIDRSFLLSLAHLHIFSLTPVICTFASYPTQSQFPPTFAKKYTPVTWVWGSFQLSHWCLVAYLWPLRHCQFLERGGGGRVQSHPSGREMLLDLRHASSIWLSGSYCFFHTNPNFGVNVY
jgi:hypothetical protein